MTQKSLSSETCLGYLSALQVHAFCRRRGIALATTRHRHFPSKAASRDQANDLTIRTCDPYLPAGIPMPLHCVSSSASTPRSAEFRKPHLCRLPLSGNALQRWNESILLSSPSLAFIQEASLRSFVDTLVLGFELCGTYQQKTLATSTVYGTQPLTSVRKIRGFLERNSRLFGAQRARAAASYLVDGSASPRETQAALLLGLPAFYGGYGLGMPSMNYEISCTPPSHRNLRTTNPSVRSFLARGLYRRRIPEPGVPLGRPMPHSRFATDERPASYGHRRRRTDQQRTRKR